MLRERYNNLPPIIAISAHAMEGDAEKYLALGMDDYLSKPVESAKLVSMLQNWLNPDTALARSSPPAESVAEKPEEQILNPSAIQVLQDTSSPDSAMMQMLFTSFLEDMEDLMLQLKKGISEDKLHDVMIAVHTIKGLSGTIGASKVFQLAKVIDQSLKEQNWNKTLSLMPELQEKYNELRSHIEEKYRLQSL
jgi:HPt (histidine-containing phosphotransfer) domain-containing protein